jgi:2-C-methyl-D-erythritol 2,4-cyclodiphosphate synthase
MAFRVGMGYDVHRLVEGRKLILGGIHIPASFGCEAHSDGDVVVHAIIDALLGAANMRDIGFHFPDNSSIYKDIDSRILLQKTINMVGDKGYTIGNIDCTICLESPKLRDHIPWMKASLAEVMEVNPDKISVKATTTEKMGFVGTGEGIAVYAVALLEYEG